MKKFLIFIIALFFTNNAFSQVSDVLNMQNRNIIFSTQDKYTVVEDIGFDGFTDAIGSPKLPTVVRKYVLPENSKFLNLTISKGSKTLLGNDLYLIPVQPPCLLNEEPCPDFVSPNSILYNSTQPFPEEVAIVKSEESILGYQIVTIEFCPFEYIPKERKLYFFNQINISIDVQFQELQKSKRVTALRNSINKDFVKSLVTNSSSLETMSNTSEEIVSPRSNFTPQSLPTDKLQIPWNPSLYGNVPDFVIITNNELSSHLKSFVDYKIRRGIPTLVVTVEQICQDFPGVDKAEKIRNYLKKAHHYWGDGLFVLLAGDNNIIPARIGTYECGGGCFYRTTDMYYSDVYRQGDSSFNWNPDGDNVFVLCDDDDSPNCYPDYNISPDNFIGRIPVKTVEGVENITQKVMAYENLQNVDDINYVNNILLSGGYTSLTGANVGQVWQDHLYNQSFWTNNINMWRVYDDHDPSNAIYGNNRIGDEELDKQTIISRMSYGHPINNQDFHFFAHVEHGGPYGIGTSGTMKGQTMYREDADNLQNTNNYQIMYSGSCDSGEIDKDCIAKHFINNQNAGGVAVIANSGFGWTGNEDQEKELFKSIYDNSYSNGHIIGVAVEKSKMASEISFRENAKKNLTLYGDPTLPIWSTAPQNIILATPTSITIENNDNNQLNVGINVLSEEATVTLYKHNEANDYPEVFAVQTIPAGDTSAVFELHPDTPGNLNVQATAKNYLPAQNTVNLLMPQSHLYITGYTYTDENGNGLIEQGENIILSISLTNAGNASVSNINTTLSCLPELATVTIAQKNHVTTVNPEQTITLSGYAFTPLVNMDIEEIANFIEFWLDISASESYNHIDNFYLNIHNPSPQLGARALTNSAGETINYLTPQQVVNTVISVHNAGNVSTGILDATLSSDLVNSGVLEITTPMSSYETIEMYAEKQNNTPFQFKLLQPHTGAMPFTLTLTNALGNSWSFEFDMNDALPPLISGYDFSSGSSYITLSWDAVNNAQGYNVYRCDEEEDVCNNDHTQYHRVNDFLLEGSAMFEDNQVEQATEYYYKIAIVSQSGQQRSKPQLLTDETYVTPGLTGYKAWTSLDEHEGFPMLAPVTKALNPVTVADIDGNGEKELFPTFSTNRNGLIMGLYEDGEELFDIDGNSTTTSGFAKVVLPPDENNDNDTDGGELWSKAAVGDIDNDGSAEVFVTTCGNYYATGRGYLFGYRTQDNDGDSQPDQLWNGVPKELGRRSLNAPVLADIDNDENHSMEIIVPVEENKIIVFDAEGNVLWAKQPSPVRAPGDVLVADLNGDGTKEIIMGTQNELNETMGLYIWDYEGNDFADSNPVYSNGNERFSTNPIAADIDNDNELEIIIVGRYENQHKLYAFNGDGSFVNGNWNGQISLDLPSLNHFTAAIEQTPQPSVGDLNNDGILEVAIADDSKLTVFDNLGNVLSGFPITIDELSSGRGTCPILADIDNDDDIEIVVVAKNDRIYAFNPDGTECTGWRLKSGTTEGFKGAPTVADIDNDGYNEVIANDSDMGIHVWRTSGDADKIEWGSYRSNPQNTGVYKNGCAAGIDLYIKDGATDLGIEPNTFTEYMWTSRDIWIRNENDNGLEHQNPEYKSDNQPNYIKVRLINRGCEPSLGTETLTINWAKANTELSYPQNWDGSLQNDSGYDLGGEVIGCPVPVPVIQPGEEKIVTIPWTVPNPENYLTGSGSDDPWHFCVLATIHATQDPLSHSYTTNPNIMVRENNNQAWKNLTIVDLVEEANGSVPMGIVAVSNPKNYPKTYTLELVKEANETGKAIFDEAEVTITMDDTLFDAWERGGETASNLSNKDVANQKLVKGNHVVLDNIAFEAKDYALLQLQFNFLTKKLTSKTKYTYHVVQKDAQTGEIVGGETFIIKKPNRTQFEANAGEDLEVGLNESITLSAEDINEPAIYNWYDSNGNLIFQGKDLEIANAVAQKYKLEVISTVDGFKDYDEVQVLLKPSKIDAIAPNPASQNLTVEYTLNDVDSAYLMVIGYYGDSTSYNYILDTNVAKTIIDVSQYSLGFYTVVLICDGQVVDTKTLIKQ